MKLQLVGHIKDSNANAFFRLFPRERIVTFGAYETCPRAPTLRDDGAKPPHDKKKLPKRSAEHAYDDLAPVEGLRWAPERF